MSHSNDWRLTVTSNLAKWWNRSRSRGGVFRQPKAAAFNAQLTGITKDSLGANLGGCTVDCFVTGTDQFVTTTISDGSGNFTLLPPVSGPFYLVAYLSGVPDVAGTTVNTLIAS